MSSFWSSGSEFSKRNCGATKSIARLVANEMKLAVAEQGLRQARTLDALALWHEKLESSAGHVAECNNKKMYLFFLYVISLAAVCCVALSCLVVCVCVCFFVCVYVCV